MAGEVVKGGYLSRERSCLKCVARVSLGARAILFNREIIRTATRAIIVLFTELVDKQRNRRESHDYRLPLGIAPLNY